MSQNLKKRVFRNNGGMSRTFKTGLVGLLQQFFFNLRRRKKTTKVGTANVRSNWLLPYWSECFVTVALPPTEQFSRHHPGLVRRLHEDLGKRRLSLLQCSTGDFGKALREGRISLGHIWAEIYSICLDEVSYPLGYGHIVFQESFRTLHQTDKKTTYRIRLFYSEPFPDEFYGWEYRVTGYLNATMHDEEFPLRQRLADFIRYNRCQDVEVAIKVRRPLSKRRAISM